MDGLVGKVTVEELKIFYGLDRELYTILVQDLSRNPSECLHIMGFWLWLERAGFHNLVSRILSLETPIINWACDEALACLHLIASNLHHLSPPPILPAAASGGDISLTLRLLNTEAHLLEYFSENRLAVLRGVQSLVSEVCIPVLSDILERARHGAFNPGPVMDRSPIAMTRCHLPTPIAPPPSPARVLTLEDVVACGFSSLNIGDGDPCGPHKGEAGLIPRFSRTMFVTFSKGYPVTEVEVREFFGRLFGSCIESLYMQEVGAEEQSLYARIVFVSASYIHFILNGETKAKLSINGKHVWMRQFVPRDGGRVWACSRPARRGWDPPQLSGCHSV